MFCSRCGTWAPDDTATCPLCGLALQVDNWPRVATTPTLAAPPIVPIVVYGGFWRRLVAAFLDSILLFFPVAILRVFLGLSASGVFDPFSSQTWIVNTFDVVISGLYAVILTCSSRQATLGMQVMDLKLTDLKGDRISVGRSIGRYLAQFVSILTIGIGYLIQPFTSRRQMLHDILAGTVVVRPRREPAPGGTPAPAMRLVP